MADGKLKEEPISVPSHRGFSILWWSSR